MGFIGSATLFGDSNFSTFTDGSLTNNLGTFAWGASITRDMNTGGNAIDGNPDRADNATAFAGEPFGVGTLGEVFGTSLGYRNMSYLIDGEDNRGWSMNLFFGGNRTISADSDDSTVEVSVLERGGNSDFNVYGILADQSTTSALFVSRGLTGQTGWSLNSLEIGGAQNVYGVGISLDSSWTNLIGLRIEALSNFNGPDIVAVGTAAAVPGPASLCLLALLGLKASRRRRG